MSDTNPEKPEEKKPDEQDKKPDNQPAIDNKQEQKPETFNETQQQAIAKMIADANKSAVEEYKKQQQEETDRKALEAKGDYEKLLEKERQKAADLQTQLNNERLANIRLRIGTKYNLPANLISRLVGENEQEIENDAKELKKSLPESPDTGTGTPTGGNGGQQKGADKQKTAAYKREYNF